MGVSGEVDVAMFFDCFCCMRIPADELFHTLNAVEVETSCEILQYFQIRVEQVSSISLVEVLLVNVFINKVIQLVPKAQLHSEPKQVSSNRGYKYEYI